MGDFGAEELNMREIDGDTESGICDPGLFLIRTVNSRCCSTYSQCL